MPPVKLPYLVRDKDRYGKVRLYVRVVGQKKIKLAEPEGSPAFFKAYTTAVEQAHSGVDPKTPGEPPKNTLGWLVRLYCKSPDYIALEPRSQRVKFLILDKVLKEPPSPGSPKRIEDMPLDLVEPKLIKVLRDRLADRPGAALNRVKALKAMFAWAIEAEHLKVNPCLGVKRPKYKSAGFYTWTVEEVYRYLERHGPGTKARLALGLLLFLGVRRSDAVLLGPKHLKGDWLHFTIQKTKKSLHLPILPVLSQIIGQSAIGDETFLVTEYGQPFSVAGFGAWFRKRCDEAGLPHCTAHGLRKAGATIAAENGATEQQMMAIFGWDTARQAAEYAKAASQKKLAGSAMHLLLPILATGVSVQQVSNPAPSD